MICPYCLTVASGSATSCPQCRNALPIGAVPPLAGIFGRFFAMVLDSIFCFLPGLVTLAVMVFTNDGLKMKILSVKDFSGACELFPDPAFFLPLAIAGGLTAVFGFIDLAVLLVSSQSIGKKLLDLRIVRKDMQPAAAGRLLLRETIGKAISAAPAFLGFFAAFFNRDRATLHDMVAGTRVVRKLRLGESCGTRLSRPAEYTTVRSAQLEHNYALTPPPAPAEPPETLRQAPQNAPDQGRRSVPAPSPRTVTVPPPPVGPMPPPVPPAPEVHPPPYPIAPHPNLLAPTLPPSSPAPSAAQPPPIPVLPDTVPKAEAFPLKVQAIPIEEVETPFDSPVKPTLPIESVPHPTGRFRPKMCPGCKNALENVHSLKCSVCGFEQIPEPAEESHCPRCEAHLPPNSRFCNNCGASLISPAAPKTPAISVPPVDIPDGAPAARPSDEEAPAPRPRLVSYSAEGEKEVFPIVKSRIRLGRATENDIAFPGEKAISHRHCEIYEENSAYFIHDLGSTNGVYVNNEKTALSPITDGDKIKLGFKVFRFTV